MRGDQPEFPGEARARQGGGGCGNEKSSPRGLLFWKSGAGNRSRTYDLRITNALLYQLSYAGKTICFCFWTRPESAKQNIFFFPVRCLFWGPIWKDRNHIRVFSRWETRSEKILEKDDVCVR